MEKPPATPPQYTTPLKPVSILTIPAEITLMFSQSSPQIHTTKCHKETDFSITPSFPCSPPRILDNYTTALLLDEYNNNNKWQTAWDVSISKCTPIDPIPGPTKIQILFSITDDDCYAVHWIAGEEYDEANTFEHDISESNLLPNDIPITVPINTITGIPRDNYFAPSYSVATSIQFATDLLKTSVVTYRQYYRHFLTAYNLDMINNNSIWYDTWISILALAKPTTLFPAADITRLTELLTSIHEQQLLRPKHDINNQQMGNTADDDDGIHEDSWQEDDISYTTPIAKLEYDHYQRCSTTLGNTTDRFHDFFQPYIQRERSLLTRQTLLCTIPNDIRHAKYIDVVTGTTFWENALDAAQQRLLHHALNIDLNTHATNKSLLFYITYDGRRKIRFHNTTPIQITNNDTKRLKTSPYIRSIHPTVNDGSNSDNKDDTMDTTLTPFALPLTLDTIPHHISHAFKVDVATGTTHWQDAVELQFRYLRTIGLNPRFLTPGTYFDFRIKQNGTRKMRTCTKDYTTCPDTDGYKDLPNTHNGLISAYLSKIPRDIDHAIELDIKTRTRHWRDARAVEFRRLRHWNISPMDLHPTTTFTYHIYSNGTREIITRLHPSNRATIGVSALLVTDSPALPSFSPHPLAYFIDYQDIDIPIDEVLERITTATINAQSYLTFSNNIGYQNVPEELFTSPHILTNSRQLDSPSASRPQPQHLLNQPTLPTCNQNFRNGRD